MAFKWKDKDKKYIGEGVYHLTFAVVNRRPLLGELVDASHVSSNGDARNYGGGQLAKIETSNLGRALFAKTKELEVLHPELEVIWVQIMPDHLHAVIWMHEGFEDSIKMLARGFAQGCSKIARRYAKHLSINNAQSNCAKPTNRYSTTAPTDPYDCGNGAHTLFSTPFIRTLSHKGQLDRMVKYVKANPDNAWRRKLAPDLYVIRRDKAYADLHFDTMGKERLLDYPDRNVVALSRSLTPEQIETEVQKALAKAERGVVTYCAAMNEGERAVTRAIREAGYPLVVMMLDGFPPEGSEAARFFHPGGAYHKACGEGQLYLMAPLPANYTDQRVIDRTEEELARKAQAKGSRYTSIPHDTKRWRMIAGNVMLHLLAEE